MAHPMRADVKDAINAKLHKMTREYGAASGPANNILAPTNRAKGEGPEPASEFGATSGAPRPRADRASRLSNPIPTLATGGAVKRANGGRAKKKGGTNVNVIVAPQGGATPPMPPPVIAGPPPAMPMPPKPPMGAPGLPPGGGPIMPPPPGLPPPGMVAPRARGGRIDGDEPQGDAVTARTLKNEGLVRGRAKGGHLPHHHMTAGAATGVGRLQKIGEEPEAPGKPQAV